MTQEPLTQEELVQAWPILSDDDRLEGFSLLGREDAEDLIDQLDARQTAELLLAIPPAKRRVWMRYLDPDDAADVIQAAPEEARESLLELLDPATRKEINALLAYAEDEAGGLMNPRFARLRPDMTVDEAIAYLRRQTPERVENIYYAYVLDSTQKLLGVVSLRELFMAPPGTRVRDVMETDLVTVTEETDQEEVSHLFAQHDLMALPVVDDEGHMKGIVTVDDIVDVFREEATEDIQKLSATEALDAPYLEISIPQLLAKRLGWLAVLLVAEFLTVEAMSAAQAEIQSVIVLALFVPLIIASGGNCGSQAATLVVRAMALGEVRLRDWSRVARRELAMGLTLGLALAVLGFGVVLLWNSLTGGLGDHALLLASTIATSIVAVCIWGTLIGSMLPIALRALKLDPASASNPLVATLMDSTGMVIYFTVAGFMLRGTLL